MHPRTLSVVLSIAVVAACAETPVAPDQAIEMAPGMARQAEPVLPTTAPAKYVVVFGGTGAPSDFAATVGALGGTVLMNHPLGVAVVTGLDDASAATLRGRVGAQYVEAQPELELIEPASLSLLSPAVAVVEDTRRGGRKADADAAQPIVLNTEHPEQALLFARQWNMVQVNAPAAWENGHLGSQDVTVAILDTGIDYLLPDLAGRVDLTRSASFEPIDDIYAAYYFPGRHPSTDLHYHGTNVATQVASNAWAFAGVTSKTTLMSVKVCSVLGGCHGVIEGILYAIDHGADVINMSLGGWFSKAAYPGYVSALNSIFNYASQKGVTIVVAAGNDANDLDTQDNIAIYDGDGNLVDRRHVPSFFATYCDATHVLCVSATRGGDVPSSYTNYGYSAIDVAAPGGDGSPYNNWVYALCPQTSLIFACGDAYYILGVAGTSQATPHVAGLAALAVQEVGRSPAQVAAYVRNSADALAGVDGAYYGAGRINVGHAVGVN